MTYGLLKELPARSFRERAVTRPRRSARFGVPVETLSRREFAMWEPAACPLWPPASLPLAPSMEWMAGQVKRGRYLYCPNGSHLAEHDDQKVYFAGLVQFIRDVDRGHF